MSRGRFHACWMAAILISLSAPIGAQTSGRSGGAAAAEDKTQVELEFWRSVERMGTADAYQAYLEAYPNGRFAPLARVASRRAAPVPSASPAAPPAAASAMMPVPSVPRLAVTSDATSSSGNQLPVLNQQIQHSGGATFAVGERIRGPGVITMGRLGARKQVPIPEGEWTLIAAVDHDTESQLMLGRPGVSGFTKVSSLALAEVQGATARSMLLVTLNRLAPPAYNFRWPDQDQCEQAAAQSWLHKKEKGFFADQCMVIRPVGPKGAESVMPAALWKEMSSNLGKLGGSLTNFNLETSIFTISSQAAYMRVTRLDCHQISPGAAGCADFSPLLGNWFKPPEGFAARSEWALRYMPLAYDGFRRNLTLPELSTAKQSED